MINNQMLIEFVEDHLFDFIVQRVEFESSKRHSWYCNACDSEGETPDGIQHDAMGQGMPQDFDMDDEGDVANE